MQFGQLKRREFISVLGAAAACPRSARAQQLTMPVIGLLGSETPELFASRWRAFGEGLSATGYTEGRSYTVEFRWAHGRIEQLPALAADLVRRQVSVIVTPGEAAALRAAGQATDGNRSERERKVCGSPRKAFKAV